MWATLSDLFTKKMKLHTEIQQQQEAVDGGQEEEKTELQAVLDKSKADLLTLFQQECELQQQLIKDGSTPSNPGSSLSADQPEGANPIHTVENDLHRRSSTEEDNSDPDDDEPSSNVRYTFKLTRPEKYKEGDSFADFCADFKEHVQLTRMKDDNLGTYFLNLVDATTKKKLRKVTLSAPQRRNPDKFIPIFRRKMMPPHEAENLQMDFSDLKQEADDSIETFAHRVEDTASLAFAEDTTANVNDHCLSAFIKGLNDTELRIQLRAKSIRKFPEAVEEAIRRHGIRRAEEKRRPPVRDPEIPEEVYHIHHDSKPEDREHRASNYRGRERGNQHPRRGGNNSQYNEKPRLCFNCNQPNHLAKHCLLKKPDSLNC